MTAIQALTGVFPDQLPTDAHNEVVWQNSAQVGRKLARILNKMVRFKSGERYQSAQEVLNDLNDLNVWRWRQFVKLLPVLVMVGIVSIIVYTKIQRSRAEKSYNIGIERTEKGDFKGAIAAYNEAIAIEPNFTKALANKGYAYGKLGIFTQQFHSCIQATGIDPNSYQAWLCVGNAQSGIKQFQDSIQYFDKAIDFACNSTDDLADDVCVDAWNSKGESWLGLQKPDEALKAFEQAIQKNPKNYFAWTYKGEILLNTSPQEALKAFNTALDIEPNYKPALEGKKTAIRRLGN